MIFFLGSLGLDRIASDYNIDGCQIFVELLEGLAAHSGSNIWFGFFQKEVTGE